MENKILMFVITVVITITHVALSNPKKTKFRFLGGIVPVVSTAIGFWSKGTDLFIIQYWFALVVFLLIWFDGYTRTKKNELQKMKAKDI